MTVALLAMAGALYWLALRAGDWLQMATLLKLTWLALLVVAGAVVYFAVLWLLGFRPRDFSKRVIN